MNIQITLERMKVRIYSSYKMQVSFLVFQTSFSYSISLQCVNYKSISFTKERKEVCIRYLTC